MVRCLGRLLSSRLPSPGGVQRMPGAITSQGKNMVLRTLTLTAACIAISFFAYSCSGSSSDPTSRSSPTTTGTCEDSSRGCGNNSATAATPAARTPADPASATATTAAIAQMGLVSNVDLDKEPDPTRYVTSFKSTDKKIGVLVQLSPSGAAGEVVCEWRLNGRHLDVTGALKTRVEPGRWVYFDLTHKLSEFQKGDYEVVITVNGSEAQRTLTFAIQ